MLLMMIRWELRVPSEQSTWFDVLDRPRHGQLDLGLDPKMTKHPNSIIYSLSHVNVLYVYKEL